MLVLRLGTRRFWPVPSATEAMIRGIDDPERLGQLAERVLDATDWDDLLATP